MSVFLLARLFTGGKSAKGLSFIQFETPFFISRSRSSLSQSERDSGRSFTVSYLINSCGLSPKSALSASKYVQFNTPDRPDSFIAFLGDHGFTHEHIPKLVRSHPQLLLTSEKTLLPKIQLLYSIGFSTPDIVKFFYSCPKTFLRSLRNALIPCYDFLKSVVVVDEKVVSKALALRDIGIPESFVPYIVTCYGAVVIQDHRKLKLRAEQLIEIGFDPKKQTFIQAMHVLESKTHSMVEHKIEILRGVVGLKMKPDRHSESFPCAITLLSKKKKNENSGFPCEQDRLAGCSHCQNSICPWLQFREGGHSKVFSVESSAAKGVDKERGYYK